MAAVATGTTAGFGLMSYVLALQDVAELLAEAKEFHEIDHHCATDVHVLRFNGNENLWPGRPLYLRLRQ